MKYVDFDILISRSPGSDCEIRADSESHGEDQGVLSLDVLADDFRKAIERLENRQTDRQFLQQLGERLYQAIFTPEIDRLFQRSYGAVERDEQLGLRLRLHIEPPDISALPWELLYSSADKDFLGTRVITPLVRYLRMNRVKRDLATEFPLRVLVVIPQGSDETANLNVPAEKEVLVRSMARLGDRVEVTYLHEQFEDHRVTWDRISQCLDEKAYHCLHFIGHGLFRNDRGYIVLDGADGRYDAVEDTRFAKLFTNSPSMKLVVLNACKGATTSRTIQFAGSAAKIVECGVPAVIAMQFNILDPAAIDFARAFYTSLFLSDETGRVDVAISRGRHILEAKYGDQRELAAPVLIMRSVNGVLFVPETGRAIRDLPKSGDSIDTLTEASEETPSELEAKKFRRRITVAKAIVRTSLAVTMAVFMASWIGILDLFKFDTGTEFLVMGLANSIAPHEVSEELQIVTVDCKTAPARCTGSEGVGRVRDLLSTAIDNLSAAGAGTVMLDAAFAANEEGEFSSDPQSGARLADAVRASVAPVVTSAVHRSGQLLQTPESLREVAAAVGHGCVESKLGLARSLPIIASDAETGSQWLSLALAAFATHRGGAVLAQADASRKVEVSFADRQDQGFALSEQYTARSNNPSCSVISPGDEVAHRFIKLMPSPESGYGSVLMSDTELSQLMLEDPEMLRERFSGKLTVLGIVDGEAAIRDRFGSRDGVFWHADAINNLLLDEAIVPMRDLTQFWLMLALAMLAVALRMYTALSRQVGIVVMIGLTAALAAGSVYTFAYNGVLLNPAYHIIALWAAWFVAGRIGRKWLR